MVFTINNKTFFFYKEEDIRISSYTLWKINQLEVAAVSDALLVNSNKVLFANINIIFYVLLKTKKHFFSFKDMDMSFYGSLDVSEKITQLENGHVINHNLEKSNAV